MSTGAAAPGALDDRAASILRERAFAHLAVVDAQGRPHVSPVWADLDPTGRIICNTAEGRLKARLLQVGAPVALSAADPENPYRYAGIRGRVVERTHEGADDTIDALAKKYLGADRYPGRKPGEQRVTVVIEPEQVHGMG